MINRELKSENLKINEIIAKNMKIVMENHAVNFSEVCTKIESCSNVKIDRSTLNRYISKPNDSNFPLPVLNAFCQCFHVSLDDILKEEFPASRNHFDHETGSSELYMDIDFDMTSDSLFIEDPSSPVMKNYIQPYYCYYFSTVSAENHSPDAEDSILCGTFELKEDRHKKKTKAILKIDTKTKNENGNINYKTYTGNAIVSLPFQSLNCIMKTDNGEFCFMIFRYSHLGFFKQNCRLAEVLSVSSTPDKRYPVVHRMFLTREPLKDKDISLITPQLQLNYSDILIDEDNLSVIAKHSDTYARIIQKIREMNGTPVYRLKEKDDVLPLLKGEINSKERSLFINELRAHSIAYRFNKISPTADKNIQELLEGRGYFKIPELTPVGLGEHQK